MKKFNPIDEELIARIIDDLDGNLAPDEKLRLKQWREADPGNEAVYQEFCQIHREMNILAVRQKIDVQASWADLESKLTAVKEENVKVLSAKPPVGTAFKWWIAIAASVVLCLCYYFYNLNTGEIIVSTVDNQHKRIVLPDGTVAVLNQNTAVKYNEELFKTGRKLDLLYGEAFFSVRPNPASVFSIDLGMVKAIDLGTSFNAERTNDHVSIIVQSGKVALKHSSDNRQIILNPGMKGVYLVAENKLSDTPNVNVNYKAWIDKKLVFVNSPLPYVVKQLENTYHAKLTLKGEALRNRKLTAQLQYQTIDSALVILSASLHCNFKIQDGHYILTE